MTRPRAEGARGAAALVTAIAVTAVALRTWRIAWGLSDGDFFFDELIFSSRAMRWIPFSLASFAVPPAELYPYPPLYGSLAGSLLALGLSVGLLEGEPHVGILAARLASAALGLATVVLVGLIGRRFYCARTGLMAAAFLAVTPFHVMHSHIAATDVTLTTAFALALLGAGALVTRPTPPIALLAGAAAGLAFTTKYTGLAALAAPGWALIEAVGRRPWRLVGLGLLVLAGFGAAVVLTCPPCATHLDLVLAGMEKLRVITGLAPFANNRLTEALGWYGRPYLYQLVAALPYVLGWPLYGLALVGTAVALRQHRPVDRLLLASIVPYLIVMGDSRVTFPRYLLPLFPALVVLAARALLALPAYGRTRMIVFATVLLYSLALSVTQVERFSWTQQRDVAAWVQTLESGARPPIVAAPRAGPDYFRLRSAFVRAGLELHEADDGRWLDGAPDVFILPDWYATAIRRDGARMRRARDEFARLESGAAGYRPAARWRSSYLQEPLYTWLDPGFASDLWQGEIGFTAYVRERSPLCTRAAGASESAHGLTPCDRFP